jgi:hypothetical protein
LTRVRGDRTRLRYFLGIKPPRKDARGAIFAGGAGVLRAPDAMRPDMAVAPNRSRNEFLLPGGRPDRARPPAPPIEWAEQDPLLPATRVSWPTANTGVSR